MIQTYIALYYTKNNIITKQNKFNLIKISAHILNL